MNEVIRYVVRMRNGDFMLQDFDEVTPNKVLINTVDNPIDATLLRTKKVAKRCISQLLSGDTNLLTLYDDDNPPKDVMELKINYTIEQI